MSVNRDGAFVSGATLRPDGSLVYAKANHISRFVRDPDLYLDTSFNMWLLPSAVEDVDNDVRLREECATLIHGLVVWPDTGRVVVDCAQDLSLAVDGITLPRSTAIFNLGYTSHILGTIRANTSAPRELVVFDGNGDPTRVPGVVDPDKIVGTRARADGFLVASSDSAVAGELLHVAFDGTAVKLGDYAPCPGGLLPTGTDFITGTAPYRVSVIDTDGVLFQLATGQQSGTTNVVRRPLAPATATVVYGPSGKPVTLGDSFRTLLTGP